MQFKYLYWLHFNKYKITTILLLQPLSQATAFLVATMLLAGTPSDVIFLITSLPCVLRVLPLGTHITPFCNGRLCTLPSQLYTPQILLFPISVNDGGKTNKILPLFSNW